MEHDDILKKKLLPREATVERKKAKGSMCIVHANI